MLDEVIACKSKCCKEKEEGCCKEGKETCGKEKEGC
jgi:hypothetical protein